MKATVLERFGRNEPLRMRTDWPEPAVGDRGKVIINLRQTVIT